MDCEVVVVGGGIGGLTVAALLAARGVDVCLLERESRVGGCAASFEKFGYSFEQGYGLYAGWHSNEIHDRVFSELPVDPPYAGLLEPGYVVRLPDQSEIALTANIDSFEGSLREVFPECADKAVSFYRKLAPVGAALRHLLRESPELLTASRTRQTYRLLSQGRIGRQILASSKHTTLPYLDGVSTRFRRFIDVQLQALAQAGAEEVSYLYAALALSAPSGGLFAIEGGGSQLAEKLAESIKKSGGKIRLNAPVLRLSYDSTGQPSGIDLLSGENVTASRAIVSNLTLWDTYGKLVGLNRTPAEIRKAVKSLRGWGAYLLYLGMQDDNETPLLSNHVLAVTSWQDGENDHPKNSQLFFAPAPPWDQRAPAGRRAVTVHAFTEVEEWFTFHKDDTDLEDKDQAMLEACWHRLHSAMPELGSRIEVIDTATPRSFYDQTRRKLGMVGGVVPTPAKFWLNRPSYLTSFPNLYIVSDTTFAGGVGGLTVSAFNLANKLTGSK